MPHPNRSPFPARFVAKAVARLALAFALALGVACGQTPCDLSADCLGSDEARAAGRCDPQAVCMAGRCEAFCPKQCAESRADVNPCPGGQLCNRCPYGDCAQSLDEAAPGRCSALPIACDSAAQCPRYLPGDGAWRCEQGICQIPGYQYTAR